MEEHTRNLLNGIGQPDFAYRQFDQADHGALLEKWPLLRLVAQLPEMRATAPGRDVRRNRFEPAGGDARPARPEFLSTYDRSASPAPAAEDAPGLNVRALLGRLSEDRR